MNGQRCDGKRKYGTEAAARAALRRMRRTCIDVFRLRVYHCTRHNGWHVGNLPLRGLRRPTLKAQKDVA